MSTKIYEGYRFPVEKLHKFLVWFDRKCYNSVSKHIKTTMLPPEGIKELRRQLHGVSPEIREQVNKASKELVSVVGHLLLWMKLAKKQMGGHDCSCNLFESRGWMYMIPYVSRHVKLQRNKPEWLQEFSYFNNTDKPEEISQKEWAMRGREWERVALKDWNKYRLQHVVFEFRDPQMIGLTQLVAKMFSSEEDKHFVWGMSTYLFWEWEQKEEAAKKKKK